MDEKNIGNEKILQLMENDLMHFKMKFPLTENFNLNEELIKIINKNLTVLVVNNIELVDPYIDIVHKLFSIKKGSLTAMKNNISKLNKKKKTKYDNEFSDDFIGDDTEFEDFGDLVDKLLKVYPIYYDNTIKMWWKWDLNALIWRQSNEEQMICLINECVVDPALTTKSTYRIEIMNYLRIAAANTNKKPTKPNENWIQFGKQIFDIKELKKITPSPEFFVTNIIPWDIGTSKETPTIDKLFNDWVVKEGVQDESYVKTMYEITAYTMLSYGPLQKLIALTGSGANGKSTYVKILKKLHERDDFNMGGNVTSTTIFDLTRNFGSSALHKKLLCLISEVNAHEMKFTNLLKSLSGEDLIRFEFKGKDAFTDVNTCTVLITSNTLPKTNDTTDGFYRRWDIVDFPNKFTVKRKIMDEIPDEEFNNLCFKSIGILNKLLKEGNFTNTGTIEDQIKKYESRSSPINMFLQECCSYDTGNKIKIDDLVYWVNWFFTKNKINKIAEGELISFLRREGYTFTKDLVKGIKLKQTNDITREQFRRDALMDEKVRKEKLYEARKKHFDNIELDVNQGKIDKNEAEYLKHKYDEEETLMEAYKGR